MKEGYVIREQEKAHFITATVVDCIDVFLRKNYRGNNINWTGIIEVEILEIPKVDVLKPSSFDKYISWYWAKSRETLSSWRTIYNTTVLTITKIIIDGRTINVKHIYHEKK